MKSFEDVDELLLEATKTKPKKSMQCEIVDSESDDDDDGHSSFASPN